MLNKYIPSLFMTISQFLACYLFDHVFLKLLLHSSRNSRTLKVKALFLPSETSETYPFTWLHITEERSPEPHHSGNHRTRLLQHNCLFNSTISQTRIKMSFAKIFVAVLFLGRLDALHICIFRRFRIVTKSACYFEDKK